MDCHVFRRLCDELAPALMGCRIEKIHRPAKDVTLFTLYGTGGKRFLFLRAGRKAPFLFLSTHKIPVGSAPPADIMRLRKYLADRRIIDVLPDWVGRRLYLHVNADTECWLTLDLREGPSLLFDAPPEPEIPAWPDPAHWAEACEGDGWRNWPVITPPLRRTLPLLPPDEQAALLLDLEAGGGDLFLYENAAGERELSAWPLPPERRRDGQHERESGRDAQSLRGEVAHERARPREALERRDGVRVEQQGRDPAAQAHRRERDAAAGRRRRPLRRRGVLPRPFRLPSVCCRHASPRMVPIGRCFRDCITGVPASASPPPRRFPDCPRRPPARV